MPQSADSTADQITRYREFTARLGMAPKNFVENVAERDNTASTTHFVALYEYLEAGRFKPGDEILLLSLASGLEVGVVIFRMDELVDHDGHGALRQSPRRNASHGPFRQGALKLADEAARAILLPGRIEHRATSTSSSTRGSTARTTSQSPRSPR